MIHTWMKILNSWMAVLAMLIVRGQFVMAEEATSLSLEETGGFRWCYIAIPLSALAVLSVIVFVIISNIRRKDAANHD